MVHTNCMILDRVDRIDLIQSPASQSRPTRYAARSWSSPIYTHCRSMEAKKRVNVYIPAIMVPRIPRTWKLEVTFPHLDLRNSRWIFARRYRHEFHRCVPTVDPCRRRRSMSSSMIPRIPLICNMYIWKLDIYEQMNVRLYVGKCYWYRGQLVITYPSRGGMGIL